jgi:DUF1009 family protein
VSEEIKLGVIAGSGEIPIHICQRAKKEGYSCVVAGIKGDQDPKLKQVADVFAQFEVNDLMGLLSWLQQNGVNQVVLAGKVKHKVIYSKNTFFPLMSSLLEWTGNRNPEQIIKAVFDYIERQGIKVMNPARFIPDFFCEQEGVLTKKKMPSGLKQEFEYGWPVVKQIADLDIGQTLVIKNKAVVAVEGMEGTDRAIQRGGDIAGPGCVVLKAARTHQDPRIDQPTVGLKTVQTLKQAGCSALCIQAKKVLFLDKRESLKLAEDTGITIIAKN